ncbi:hypothetical protein TNCV_1992871 [Trichonephila clavipes]|nr:hypothetical protein TNCV_1992871 [Trichonephila clavipes]
MIKRQREAYNKWNHIESSPPIKDTFQRLKKMPHRRIRTHYKILSKIERGRIIGLKETGWVNRRTARHMGRSEADIRRSRQEWTDSGKFQRHDDSG